MRKTQLGVDRIAVQQARITVSMAKRALDEHTKLCYQCKQAGSDVYGHCSLWWAVARNLHQTRRALAIMEQPPSQGELTLWDEDQP